MEKVKEKVAEKIENRNIDIDWVKDLVITTSGRIEETNQKNFVNMKEELEAIKNRSIQIPTKFWDNRETISFNDYKWNPMAFPERVEENIIRNWETRWSVIRNMLDEFLRSVMDNWWTVTWNDIDSYNEFKRLWYKILV